MVILGNHVISIMGLWATIIVIDFIPKLAHTNKKDNQQILNLNVRTPSHLSAPFFMGIKEGYVIFLVEDFVLVDFLNLWMKIIGNIYMRKNAVM